MDDGTERLKGQLRNNRTQERPQDYGSEKIEGSAQCGAALAGRSEEAFLKSRKQELERGGSRTGEPERADAPAERGRQKLIREKAKERENPARRKGPNAQPKTAFESKPSTPDLAEPQRIQAIPQNGNMSDGISQRPLPATGIEIKRSNALERLTTQRTIVKERAAAAPIRRKIKADAPKIKTSANTVKQPVSAMERAKAKAILDARSTAAARTTARTAQIGGRAAGGMARELGAAVSRALKASLEGLRALASMIAAGGGVALVVVLVLCMAALLLATPFGIFFASEPNDTGESIQTAVTSLNGEFCLVIEQIIESNPHDELVMDNDGVAAMLGNWNDVLAVYAVRITTDGTLPHDAVTMTPEKLDILRGVFWEMNRIDYHLDTATDTETEESTVTLTIDATVRSKNEMAAKYGFTAEQLSLLAELTQPEYEPLFAAIKGSDESLRLSSGQKQRILAQLPDDLSEERRQVVLTAYQLLGKVNYHWGGKSLVLGWDSHWGTPKVVTAAGSSTTGTMRPYGLDCSGFVDWVFYNVSNGAYVIGHGGGASMQHSCCAPISWAEAQPGDLAFYPDDSHVGIICGYDEAGNVQIIHCAYSANNVVVTGKSGFVTVGRPKFYNST